MRTYYLSKTSNNPSVHDSIHLHPIRLYSNYGTDSVAIILTNLSLGTVLVFTGTRITIKNSSGPQNAL